MKKLIFIIASCILVMFTSCEEDNPKPDIPTPSEKNELAFGNSELAAYGSPVVDENDNVYMTCTDDLMLDADCIVYCIAADNTAKWQATVSEPVNSLVMTGNTLIATGYSKVYALDALTGEELWNYQITMASDFTNTKWAYKPCIDDNGNIVIAMDSYLENLEDAIPARVISLSENGSLNWQEIFTTGSTYYDRFVKLSEPVAVNNKIHLSACLYNSETSEDDVRVYTYSCDGNKENEVSFGGYYPGSSILCVNNNGDLYLGLRNSDDYTTMLKKLNTNLSQEWEFTFPDYLNNKGVLDDQGDFYTTCEDGFVYKLDNSGAEVWKADFDRIYVRGELFIASDGNIYKNATTPSFIDPQTGAITDITFLSAATTEIAIRNDGTIVLGGYGSAYFIETNTSGLSEDAIWPKYGFNNKNQSLLK